MNMQETCTTWITWNITTYLVSKSEVFHLKSLFKLIGVLLLPCVSLFFGLLCTFFGLLAQTKVASIHISVILCNFLVGVRFVSFPLLRSSFILSTAELLLYKFALWLLKFIFCSQHFRRSDLLPRSREMKGLSTFPYRQIELCFLLKKIVFLTRIWC